jgi:hypothetical protein
MGLQSFRNKEKLTSPVARFSALIRTLAIRQPSKAVGGSYLFAVP